VAAIVYFEKALEDVDTVTYRYGDDEDDLEDSFSIRKSDRRLTGDPEQVPFYVQLALSGIMRGYREQGRWPERGAGIT
jgi:hypothetical protein